MAFSQIINAEWSGSQTRKKTDMSLEQYHCNIGQAEVNIEFLIRNMDEAVYDIVLEVSSLGHYTRVWIPTLMFAH